MSRDLLTMVEVLAHEKNVDQSVVLAALESALASAVKKATRQPATRKFGVSG